MATTTATTTSARVNGKAPTISLRQRMGFVSRPVTTNPAETKGPTEPASSSSADDGQSSDEDEKSTVRAPSKDGRVDKGKGAPAHSNGMERVLEAPAPPSASEDSEDDHSGSTPRGDHSRTPSANGSPRVSFSSTQRTNGKKPARSASADSTGHVRFGDSATSQPPRRSSFWSIDPAVGVALISPVGNWLTGGDHVKNLLLLILLIFYLHQIIEVPWSLYTSARSRRLLKEPTSLETARAASELQTLEIIFLTCSLASPALGAALLQRISKAAFGTEVISWFSTGVFILATGIRPWSHLIERLSERTSDLQDILAENGSRSSQSGKIGAELDDLHDRLGKIERVLQDAQNELKGVPRKADVFEYVDDALDALDRAHRTHDRRSSAARDAVHARLSSLEEMLVALRAEQRAALAMGSPSAGRSPWAVKLWSSFEGLYKSFNGGHDMNRSLSPKHGRKPSNLGTIPEYGRWAPAGAPQEPEPEATPSVWPPKAEKVTWFDQAWGVVRIVTELLLLPLRVIGISVKLSPRASVGR